MLKSRVIALLRISMAKEDISHQQHALNEDLKAHAWSLVHAPFEITEHGDVGQRWENMTLIEDRKELQEIIKLGQARQFDILWVYHDDRLTRAGGLTLLSYVRMFASGGVHIWDYQRQKFLAPDKESIEEVIYAADGMAAREYKKQIVLKTKNALANIQAEIERTHKHEVKDDKGNVIRVITVLKNKLVNIDTAKVIQMYNEGKSMRQIAKVFNCSTAPIFKAIRDAKKEGLIS